MAKTVVINDPSSGKTFHKDLTEDYIKRLRGSEIGNTIDGVLLDLPGVKLKITGGQDQAGRPLYVKADLIKGTLLTTGTKKRVFGLKAKSKGFRKRRHLLGKEITENLSQINVKIIEIGEQNIESFFETTDNESSE